MTNKNNVAYTLLFLATLFWSGNFLVGKFASQYQVPPFSLNFYRWFFAWLILAPFTIKEILQKRNYILENYKNIFYCFGHHHLGWTLGPISGKIIAGMIAEENTNLDLKPYSSLRFS